MKIVLKNADLARVINFLDSLEIAGMKSIYRTNFSMKLGEKVSLLEKNMKQLKEELKDNDEAFKEELKKLYKDKTVIDDGDSKTMLLSVKATVKEAIKNNKKKFSDHDAYAIAALFEAFNLSDEIGGDE